MDKIMRVGRYRNPNVLLLSFVSMRFGTRERLGGGIRIAIGLLYYVDDFCIINDELQLLQVAGGSCARMPMTTVLLVKFCREASTGGWTMTSECSVSFAWMYTYVNGYGSICMHTCVL